MPPKRKSSSPSRQGRAFAEEIFQEFERQRQLPAGAANRFPAATDEAIAKLYGGGEAPFTPQFFSVPGVDSPSAKLQLWVDKQRPFTKRFNCIDPATGVEKSSKLGVGQCASEWMQIYMFAYTDIAKQAEEIRKQKDVAAAVAFLSSKLPDLAKIYQNLGLLARNPNLSAANKSKIAATMKKIETYLTFEADVSLAQRIQTAQKDAFKQALAMLQAENSGLTAKEKAVLSSTLLKLANDNPELSVEKQQIIDLQTRIKNDADKAVDDAVTKLAPYIDEYWSVGKGFNLEKMRLMRDFILRELRSPKNSYKVDLPVTGKNAFTAQEISNVVSDLVRLKNAEPPVDLKEVAKKLAAKYTETKPDLTMKSVFNTAQDRSIFAQFGELATANTSYKAVSGELLQPVCESFAPSDVKEFLDLYVVYHELMMLYLIFYYTGCSGEYDDKDITSLADDWFRWLRGNPFYVNVKKSARQMNVDEFNRLAPQNFFGLLIKPQGTDEFEGMAKAYGFGRTSETFTDYNTRFGRLQALAGQITAACLNKTNLSPYSENMKFLATVVNNFGPVYSAITKGNAIRWVKGVDGRITRQPSPHAIAKCERTLETVGTQMTNIGVPQPTGEEGTQPPATEEPPATKEREIPAVIEITLKNRFPADAQNFAKDIVDNPGDAILQKYEQLDANTIQTRAAYNASKDDSPSKIVIDGYNFISKTDDKPMYIWFDGEPNPIDPKSLAGKDMGDYTDPNQYVYGQTWESILKATPIDKLVDGKKLVLQIANNRA